MRNAGTFYNRCYSIILSTAFGQFHAMNKLGRIGWIINEWKNYMFSSLDGDTSWIFMTMMTLKFIAYLFCISYLSSWARDRKLYPASFRLHILRKIKYKGLLSYFFYILCHLVALISWISFWASDFRIRFFLRNFFPQNVVVTATMSSVDPIVFPNLVHV